MAVKTITIDMEAYGLLSLNKREGQSFSQVIKAQFAPRPTAGRLKAALRSRSIGPMSEEALDAIERVVKARKNDPVRIVRL
jgi:predicted CopG family antitoxin